MSAISSNNTVNVVFNIDRTLTCRDSVENTHEAAFFLNKGMIVSAIMTHYVFPGVIELMQLLFQTPDVRVSFFSAERKERNIPFVEQLLERALGKDEYLKIKNTVRILSEDDLIVTSKEEKAKNREMYRFQPGNKQKDLLSLVSRDELSNTVLIGTATADVACHQQAKNLLYIKETMFFLFKGVLNDDIELDAAGSIPIPCKFKTAELSSDDKERLRKGNNIVIMKNESSFKIDFVNSISYEQEQIPIEDEKLIESLNKWPEKRWLVEDPSITEQIYSHVAAHQGKTRNIYREANRIYYLAGLLFTAMETAKKENIPVTEVLFQYQYKPITPSKYWPLYNDLAESDRFYEIGLARLRQVNNSLQFTSPSSYVTPSCVTEAQCLIIDQALENRTKPSEESCLIM